MYLSTILPGSDRDYRFNPSISLMLWLTWLASLVPKMSFKMSRATRALNLPPSSRFLFEMWSASSAKESKCHFSNTIVFKYVMVCYVSRVMYTLYNVCTFLCMCINMFICMYVHIYLCIYVCMYVCMNEYM